MRTGNRRVGATRSTNRDAVGLPEQHWLGAVRGRRALGAALGDMVILGDMSANEARRLAHLILHENSERIYALS